ncbi:RecBCD enzyme subunit RecD [Actinomadura rubteroloni]|uniref:RecBCD enzyme subunit RecD n=1 Tax=Actinomadura rubteroloni TaxID=1926885 RepID=A0A2P4UN37_9ACTN|nr:AAA domain-containing protein [Actinomadura rubteroloni]POM26462.1 RecBCD enzyme subunit RecD [Actinomadura rubteroloni]
MSARAATAHLADALPGPPAFVWVELPAGLAQPTLDQEIHLERVGTALFATHHGPGGASNEHVVRGRTAADDDLLDALVTENGRVAAFAQDVDPDDPARRWLRLRVYEIEGRYAWEPLDIGVDDEAIAAVRRIAGRDQAGSPAKALGWLRRTLLFPAPSGMSAAAPTPLDARPGATRKEMRRLVVLAAPGQDLRAPTACLLRGDGVVARMQLVDGEWRLNRLHRDASTTREWMRPALVHAKVDFIETTVKARLRLQMREELDRLGEGDGAETFLAVWRRYHELDNRHGLRKLRDFGFLVYTGRTPLDDSEGVVRFHVDGTGNALLRRLRDDLDAGEETELECAVELPAVLGGAARAETPDGLLEEEIARGNTVGVVTHVDVAQNVVDLRMIPRRASSGMPVDPPRRGFLHAAVWGDRRRLERRSRALKRLLRGQVPLPQLLSLLQGSPARGKEPVRGVKAMSEAVAACFRDTPNAMQRLALETALNTPDIAVIQGPPGTGKTQLIAALQVRLAETRRPHAVISQSMLLTSYQHAAVDNLVERSKVWDLPSMKIDSQNRGSTAHIEEWRDATIAALRSDLAGTEEGRIATAMRTIARRTAAYCTAPVSTEELDSLLADVAEQASGLISDALRVRLENLRMEIRAAQKAADLRVDRRRESVLRAVRGIRHLPLAFGDDGPQMAAAALTYLERTPGVDEAHLDLVRRAADWTDDDPPDFLSDLTAARDELLDRLTGGADRLVRPVAREDVVDLLNAIIDDLDARRRSGAAGVSTALLEFLDELEGDPEAVLAMLRLYTTSLAATCQQADSRAVQDARDGAQLFDTVIVDEAARANPLDLLIPLTLASRRVILVGDQNQLPHMLEPDVEQELGTGGNDALGLLRESLFGRLFALLHEGDTGGRRRAVRLNEQYRMHKTLGDFVGRHFYGGHLESPRGTAGFEHGLDGYDGRPAAWLSVPASAGREHAGQSKSRPAEARAIARELKRHVLHRTDLTFGVISFYSAQVRLIWEQLVRDGLAETADGGHRPVDTLRERLHVGTVDAFQGKEFDVVILSVTRSGPVPAFEPGQTRPDHPRHAAYERWVRRTYGHLLLQNRLCVAMSRQQRLLVVAGDEALFTSPVTPPGARPIRDFYELCAASGVVLSGER